MIVVACSGRGEVVRAARDGPAGWSRLETQLRSAVVRDHGAAASPELEALSDAHLTALLQFDRHDVVPLYHDPEEDYMGQGLMEPPGWTRARHEFRPSDLRLAE